jgi:hypothetical protein
MLSSGWLFAGPAALVACVSLAILAYATVMAFLGQSGNIFFGNYWVILAGALLSMSHVTGLLAFTSHFYGLRAGYRRPGAWTRRLAGLASLESMLFMGLGLVVFGLAVLSAVVYFWSGWQFARIANVLPAVVGSTLVVMGVQTMLGGFLIAIVNGNEADIRKTVPWDGVDRRKARDNGAAWDDRKAA